LDTIFKIFLISEIKVYKKKSIPSELYLSPWKVKKNSRKLLDFSKTP
jgi:hypothetical protein